MNIIITGASSGIDFETTKELSNNPYNKVLAIARRIDTLKILATHAPHQNIIPFQFDLLNKDFSAFFSFAKQQFQHVDALINNAGLLLQNPFLETSSDNMEILFQTNFFSAARTIQTLFPLLNNPAHIINIGSMGGFQGSVKFPGLSFYSASKSALASLTESLAEELKQYNVKINCLALGAVQTEMLSKAFPDYKAPLSAEQMGTYIADFAINGHFYYNGKVLPVSVSTP
jgi:short-subunit dehydrogenase